MALLVDTGGGRNQEDWNDWQLIEDGDQKKHKISWNDVKIDLKRHKSNYHRSQKIEVKSNNEHSIKNNINNKKKVYKYASASNVLKKAAGGGGCAAGTVAGTIGGISAFDLAAKGMLADFVIGAGVITVGSSLVAAGIGAVGYGAHYSYTYWRNWAEENKCNKKQQYNDKVSLFNEKLIKCKELELYLMKKKSELLQQEQKINDQQFLIERHAANSKVVLAIGPAGYGKSTVCNRLLGNKLDICDLSESKDAIFDVAEIGDVEPHTATLKKESKNIMIDENEEALFRLSVVDTRGAFDSKENDIHCQNEMAEYFKACGGINMFCIFFRFNTKIDDNYKQLLEIYTNFWGKRFWKHCVIVITNCDKDSKGNIKKLEKGLPTTMKQIKVFLAKVSDGLCTNIPIYEFGEENFEISTTDLILSLTDLNSNYHTKYKCDNVKSPIDALYDEIKPKLQAYIQTNNELDALSKQMKESRDKIQ